MGAVVSRPRSAGPGILPDPRRHRAGEEMGGAGHRRADPLLANEDSPKNLVDSNVQTRENGRGDEITPPVGCDTAIRSVDNLGMDFHPLTSGVHDPVLRYAALCIKSALFATILGQGALRDLDDQEGAGWVFILVRAGWHGCQIRLGFRVVSQRQRQLNPDRRMARDAKSRHQELSELLDGRCMMRALRTHTNDKTMDELDLLVREVTGMDEMFVFDTPQGADARKQLSGRRGHDGSLPWKSAGRGRRNPPVG
jgi:hypothetical protein